MKEALLDKRPDLKAPLSLEEMLEKFLQKSALPEYYGTAGRVHLSLHKRFVDGDNFKVVEVAKDLCISVRTLQRRLRQENTSFMEIRDQFKFFHGIQLVLYCREPIDHLFAHLDFENRTCFFKAFARWTGMSPSAFRRLFRDCISHQ